MVPTEPPQSLSGIISSEEKLVEKPGLDLLVELGWTHAELGPVISLGAAILP
jgi:type I restriction enzyme R subunit